MSTAIADLPAFVRGLPKAELHLHIEGTLEPELMFALAARNGVAIPFDSVETVRAAYSFSRLQDFLDIYYQPAPMCSGMREDFHDLVDGLFQTAPHVDGVVHAEIMFDPQTHTARGIPFADVVAEGLIEAQHDAYGRRTIRDHLETDPVLPAVISTEEDAFATLGRRQRPWLDRIAAVGLDSSEVGHPPSKFARAVRSGGRGRATAAWRMPARRARRPMSYEALDRAQASIGSITATARLEDPQLADRAAGARRR